MKAWSLIVLAVFALTSGAEESGPAEAQPAVDWAAMSPEPLKAAEPVSLVRNPFQLAGSATVQRTRATAGGREWVVRLRRHLAQDLKGVARDSEGPLLLLGGRVLRVGESLSLSHVEGLARYDVRIKSLDEGRLVLRVKDLESEEGASEEWIWPLKPFLQKP